MKQDAFDGRKVPLRVPWLGSEKPITFVTWLVPNGSFVIPGERVAEVLSDGVLFHIEATQGGFLMAQEVRSGMLIIGGQKLATIQVEEDTCEGQDECGL